MPKTQMPYSTSFFRQRDRARRQPRNKQTFAGELQRFGEKYFVQTPILKRPIEMYHLAPFVHWSPQAWQRAPVAHFTEGAGIQQPAVQEKAWDAR